MLGIPEVVEDAVGRLLGVVPPHGVPVMEPPVEGAACQGGNAQHCGDDGERGDDLPPHPDKQAAVCNGQHIHSITFVNATGMVTH